MKVEPPTFNGDIREFPTFFKDYTRPVISRHGKERPFILMQALQGKARGGWEALGFRPDERERQRKTRFLSKNSRCNT